MLAWIALLGFVGFIWLILWGSHPKRQGITVDVVPMVTIYPRNKR